MSGVLVYQRGKCGEGVSEECDTTPCAPKVAPDIPDNRTLVRFRVVKRPRRLPPPPTASQRDAVLQLVTLDRGLRRLDAAPILQSCDRVGKALGVDFGVLEDDRCIDTGVFQQRYLVHELVLACSPPPPRPQISYGEQLVASWVPSWFCTLRMFW